MSTPGYASIIGSSIIYGKIDYGPTFGEVYRPLTQIRMLEEAGNYTVQPFDMTLIAKKFIGAAFSILLPDLNEWMNKPFGGFPILIKDGRGDAGTSFPITIVPFGLTQTINGRTSADSPSWQLAADFGALYIAPQADRLGWQAL